MSEVKRYRINWHMEETYPSGDGEWCKFDDVSVIESDAKELRECLRSSLAREDAAQYGLAALREELAELEEEFDTLEHSNVTLKLSLAAAEQRNVECIALLRRSSASEGQDPHTWWNDRALILQADLGE